MKNEISKFLVGVFIFAGGGILNYFGSNPRILYFPAVAFCLWMNWVILAGVHTYVSKQLKDSSVNERAASRNPTQTTSLGKGSLASPPEASVPTTNNAPGESSLDTSETPEAPRQTVIINNHNQSGGTNTGIENK